MEWKQLNKQTIRTWLQKYKFSLLILLLGILLLLWPSGNKAAPENVLQTTSQVAEDTTQAVTPSQLQTQLGEVLSKIAGAGQVEVILTLRTGTQYIYQTDVTQDDHIQGEEEQHTLTRQTVLTADGSAQEKAVITQTIYPTYLGAVVISQGADQPSVKLDLRNAISSLTGLSADKITVVKMKEY